MPGHSLLLLWHRYCQGPSRISRCPLTTIDLPSPPQTADFDVSDAGGQPPSPWRALCSKLFLLSRRRCALSSTRPEMKASVPVPHNNGYSSSPTSLCVPDSATTIHAVSRISPGLVWCCGLLKTQGASSLVHEDLRARTASNNDTLPKITSLLRLPSQIHYVTCSVVTPKNTAFVVNFNHLISAES